MRAVVPALSVASLASAFILVTPGASLERDAPVTPEALGERLFFDVSLSANRTQSCAPCDDPATGFADPRGMSSPRDDAASRSATATFRRPPIPRSRRGFTGARTATGWAGSSLTDARPRWRTRPAARRSTPSRWAWRTDLRQRGSLRAFLAARLAQQAFRRKGRRRIVMLVGQDGGRGSVAGAHGCSVPVGVSRGLIALRTRKAAPIVVQRPSQGSVGAITLAAHPNGG